MTRPPRPRRRPRRDARGFSLIAVMIALALLVIGTLAVARVQTALLRTQSGTSDRRVALEIARTAMETLRATGGASAVAGTVAVDGQGRPQPGGAYSRTISVTAEAGGLRRVVVTVSYPGAPQAVRLETLIY